MQIYYVRQIHQKTILNHWRVNTESQKMLRFYHLQIICKKNKELRFSRWPSGTTTFETILSGVIPFSVPFENDGRDSVNSWNSLGHIIK